MTKTHSYRYGKYSGKTFFKTAGQGYETSFVFDSKTVFVGNFIHVREARLWYALMCRELRKVSKRYASGAHFPASWFSHYVRNHLYKTYYAFLDRLFAKYNRDYSKACVKDLRRYQVLKKRYHHHVKAA
jgi:hypothetical protein